MRACVGFTTGAFAACATAITGAMLLGTLSAPLAGLCLAFGLVAGIFAGRQTQSEPAAPVRIWDWAALLLFAFVSFRSFFWLLFEAGGELRIQSRFNLGDLALHLNLIQYLAGGVKFWPESSIFQGEPLRYPIGADLFNSLLLLSGVPVQQGLVWVGLIGAAIAAYSLWRWAGAFGVASLLMVGGFAGIDFLKTGTLGDYQSTMEWKNTFLCLFVPQRAFLFALPAGLILLTHWRQQLSGGARLLPRWAEVLLYAMMPLFSVHTFLFLSGVLLLIFVINPTMRRCSFLCVALAFLPATALVWLVGGGFGGKSFIGWWPGWMQGENPLNFWVMNFGMMIPLTLATLVLAVRAKNRIAAPFVIGACVFGLLCVFIRFSPWPWDNTKLMLWAWLALTPFIWRFVMIPLPQWGRGIVVVSLFFTGFLSLLGAMGPANSFTLIRLEELHEAEEAVKNLPRDSRFVIKPDFDHPLVILGYPVVCGYDGHLWSHGYDYSAKYEKMGDAMRGEFPWGQTSEYFKFDYVFSGPREEKAYGRPVELNPVVTPRSALVP